jgi:hypothetical protein
MAKRRYTRVEEEIIQILEKKEREPGWRQARPRLPRSPRLNLPRVPGRFRLDGLAWLGLTFGLALAAILVGGSHPLLSGLLAIASILVFLSPIVLRRRASSSLPQSPQRWRGRDIDLPPSRQGVLGDLRYRLWQARQRRR